MELKEMYFLPLDITKKDLLVVIFQNYVHLKLQQNMMSICLLLIKERIKKHQLLEKLEIFKQFIKQKSSRIFKSFQEAETWAIQNGYPIEAQVLEED